ncbi:MAG: VanZ family protein [Rhodothermales bacterium]|nr:VanZ family protein [Rhodothermales bacterium]MCA0268739.1 VanZ family protein [Bacteroidota bacterium]
MRRLSLVLALGWTLVLLVGMLIPGAGTPEVFSAHDKITHIGVFFVFALLWALALPPPRRFARVLLLSIAVAVGTEALQHLLPIGRFGDPFDAAADLIGALVGLLAAQVVNVRRVTA